MYMLSLNFGFHCRGGTIQTHEQYEFIHQALCEYEKELAEPEQTTVNGFPGD